MRTFLHPLPLFLSIYLSLPWALSFPCATRVPLMARRIFITIQNSRFYAPRIVTRKRCIKYEAWARWKKNIHIAIYFSPFQIAHQFGSTIISRNRVFSYYYSCNIKLETVPGSNASVLWQSEKIIFENYVHRYTYIRNEATHAHASDIRGLAKDPHSVICNWTPILR